MPTQIDVASAVVDNWSWLSPIIYGVAGALLFYAAATKGVAIAEGIATAAKYLAVLAYALLTGATMADTAAQWGLNGALYACPLVWIIILIIALVALFTIEVIDEQNQTLFDMVQNALNETLTNTKNLFVLYDDAGKMTLKNINSMHSAAAAKTSEEKAALSESAAKESETNAATSEAAAKASETNAANSESAAKESETNAAVSAATATEKAAASSASAEAAKASEEKAALTKKKLTES